MENEFDRFVSTVHLIKLRPAMYTGSSDFQRMVSFFNGMMTFADRVVNDSTRDYMFGYYPNFYDWLREKKGYGHSVEFGWPQIIEDLVDTDHERLDLFFNLLEEYLFNVVKPQIRD